MSIPKEEMIRVIKEHVDKDGNPYKYVRTSGGLTVLEQAPAESISAFYWRLIKGKRKSIVAAKKEVQLEFNFR